MPFLTGKDRKRPGDMGRALYRNKNTDTGFIGKVAGRMKKDLTDFAMNAADNAKNKPYRSAAKADSGLPKATGTASRAAGSAKAKPMGGTTKMAAPKLTKPAKPAYKAKGVPDYNKDLGDFYLNATSGMGLTGSPKKRK